MTRNSPWAAPEPEPPEAQARRGSPHTGPSVIAQFNDSHSVIAILEAHGYVTAGKKRWKSPHGKNLAGVVLLPKGDKVFCHHTSDSLLGDDKPHDAFDLYARFDHGGDVRKAVKAAAEMLGMPRQRAAQ